MTRVAVMMLLLAVAQWTCALRRRRARFPAAVPVSDLSDALPKAKMRERLRGRVPLGESVFSPAQLFGSRLPTNARGICS